MNNNSFSISTRGHLVEVGVEAVELLRGGAVDVVPPVAGEDLSKYFNFANNDGEFLPFG